MAFAIDFKCCLNLLLGVISQKKKNLLLGVRHNQIDNFNLGSYLELTTHYVRTPINKPIVSCKR